MRTNTVRQATIEETDKEETFSNPIDLQDIINVCQNYSQLGQSIQWQVSCLMDIGVEEAVRSNQVSIAALPHIRSFLQQIEKTVYFGDACELASELIFKIDLFEDENQSLFHGSAN